MICRSESFNLKYVFLHVKEKPQRDLPNVFGVSFRRSVLFVWLFLLFEHLKFYSLYKPQSLGTSDREVTRRL